MDPYAAPLSDFVKERDGLARSLKEEGRPDDAKAVKAWRKPSVAAWAVNQAVRRSPGDLEALLASGAQLRQAQAHLLGDGDAEAFKAAGAEERRAVGALARHARAALKETGAGAGPEILDRVRETLHAAASDDELRSQLEIARVVKEGRAVGLGFPGIAGHTGSVGKGTGTPKPDKEAEKRHKQEVKEVRDALKTAKAASRTADAAEARAEKRADEARADATLAETELEVAREDARAARKDLDLAEARLRDFG